MKITAFNPLILTPKGADAVKLFEELGFERRHTKTGINDQGITSVDLKDANGFRVDVTQVDQLPRDMVTIRMNVDNFEEAYEFLKSMDVHSVRSFVEGGLFHTLVSRLNATMLS